MNGWSDEREKVSGTPAIMAKRIHPIVVIKYVAIFLLTLTWLLFGYAILADDKAMRYYGFISLLILLFVSFVPLVACLLVAVLDRIRKRG